MNMGEKSYEKNGLRTKMESSARPKNINLEYFFMNLKSKTKQHLP
jgi:hypothetical protein